MRYDELKQYYNPNRYASQQSTYALPQRQMGWEQIPQSRFNDLREEQKRQEEAYRAAIEHQWQKVNDWNTAYNYESIPRNSYGQPLYSEKCDKCRDHQEERMECDLCEVDYVFVRKHIIIYEDTKPVSVRPLGNKRNQHVLRSTERKEEMSHWCSEAKELLTSFLMATL